MKLTIREITQIGLFAAAIAVGAQVIVPLPGMVPMTLQVWAILFASVILGAKKAALATVVYVLMGAAGLPVFAGLGGGIGVILGPTGGFILTFPIVALIVGLTEGKSRRALIAALPLALFINFAGGAAYFAIVTQNTMQAAFVAAVLPFLPAALLQTIVFAIWGPQLRMLAAQLRKYEL